MRASIGKPASASPNSPRTGACPRFGSRRRWPRRLTSPRNAKPGRSPLIETATVIEQAEEVVEPPTILHEHRPRFVDLAHNASACVDSASSRVDRLTRIALVDPGLRHAKVLSKFATRLVGRHDPMLPTRRFDQLLGRLEAWVRGPAAEALEGAEVEQQDLDWTVPWPPNSRTRRFFMASSTSSSAIQPGQYRSSRHAPRVNPRPATGFHTYLHCTQPKLWASVQSGSVGD